VCFMWTCPLQEERHLPTAKQPEALGQSVQYTVLWQGLEPDCDMQAGLAHMQPRVQG